MLVIGGPEVLLRFYLSHNYSTRIVHTNNNKTLRQLSELQKKGRSPLGAPVSCYSGTRCFGRTHEQTTEFTSQIKPITRNAFLCGWAMLCLPACDSDSIAVCDLQLDHVIKGNLVE